MEAEGAESAGRQLLAATDNRFNTYKNDPQCKGVSSLMVCKSCTASNLVNAKLNTKDGGFQIFCFDSGDITNNVSPCSESIGKSSKFCHNDQACPCRSSLSAQTIYGPSPSC